MDILQVMISTLALNAAKDVKTIHMTTANKISRIVVWSFLDDKEQKEWNKD